VTAKSAVAAASGATARAVVSVVIAKAVASAVIAVHAARVKTKQRLRSKRYG
jgi:hypothetical protein